MVRLDLEALRKIIWRFEGYYASTRHRATCNRSDADTMKVEHDVGGYLKIRKRSPNTRKMNTKTFRDTDDVRGDKESPKDCSCLKSCESPLHVPSRPLL
jgi:hypothetical protein